MRVIDPGALAARLVLERPVETPDGQGGVERSFDALATVWGRIEPVSARAVEVAGTLPVTLTHRIWLRHRADLAPAQGQQGAGSFGAGEGAPRRSRQDRLHGVGT